MIQYVLIFFIIYGNFFGIKFNKQYFASLNIEITLTSALSLIFNFKKINKIMDEVRRIYLH